MGMTGGEGALISAMLGSSLLGGITAPEGQELSSFEGKGNGVDPTSMVTQSKGLLEDYLGAMIDQANAPVNLQTKAKNLPSFSGGALPFAIGAGGMDFGDGAGNGATAPGLGMSKRRLPGQQDVAPPGPPGAPGRPPGGPMIPTSDGDGTRAQGDPAAAIELLLSMRGGGDQAPVSSKRRLV